MKKKGAKARKQLLVGGVVVGLSGGIVTGLLSLLAFFCLLQGLPLALVGRRERGA